MPLAERQTTAADDRPLLTVRRLGLLVGGPCLTVLVLACVVRPDSRGFETHTQLALPPCSFVQQTGMPCPTCGLTTAYANMVRGRVGAAVAANAAGVVFFVLTLAGAAVGAYQAVSGRDVLGKLTPRLWWVWGTAAVLLAGWALKLGIGVATGQFPLH
jgi:hypothetical protein